MAQYIDKATVVAEIKRRIQFFTEESGKSNSDIVIALFGLKYFLDTLEVKEVDLKKEIKSYFDSQPIITRSKGIDYQLIPSAEVIAKHFFEFGLKAQKGE